MCITMPNKSCHLIHPYSNIIDLSFASNPSQDFFEKYGYLEEKNGTQGSHSEADRLRAVR